MREDLIERARSEVSLRKMMHGDDRSNWSRSDRMMEELLTALEAEREYAERYRWLRSKDSGDQWRYMGGLSREAMDAAIDQARGKGVVDEA